MSHLRSLLARVEVRTLLVLVLLAGALWGFLGIAGEVREGDTHAFDQSILLALRNPADLGDPIGPRWIETGMRDLTALGGFVVLTLLTAAVAGGLALQRQGRSALFLLVAVGGGQALSHLAKLLFDRPRPELVPWGTQIASTSFPSGHSMMAAVTWLTLAMMLARAEPMRRMKAYWVALAVTVTLLVGLSRVYLGVHWPTDVLAGWTLGAAWALLCLVAARWLSRRGQIEPERGEAR